MGDGAEQLDRLAELSRAEPDEVIDAAMRAAREMLGMEMSFISRIGDGKQYFEEASGDFASFDLPPGTTIPVADAYCERMTQDRIPNLVPDVPADERTKDVAATMGSAVGAYVGVPLRLGDGEVYGSFCCLSHATQERLTERDVKFMHVLARMVADHIDRQRAERDPRSRDWRTLRRRSAPSTSGGTATATPTDWPARRSRSPRRSAWPATPTTR